MKRTIKILINKKAYNFISTYKPPNVNASEFIDHLETMVHSNNMNNNYFIIGDLNLDLLSERGDPLNQFMINNKFKNYIEFIKFVIKVCFNIYILIILFNPFNS